MARTTKGTKENVVMMEQALETSKRAMAENTLKNAYEIWGKKIADVRVELMDVDDSYQRVVSNTVKKLMQAWDNDQCTFLWASYRDGKFYIIDGQHRLAVAKAKGIESLPCIIFTGLSREDEALIFARQNLNVKKLLPVDTFKANIANGNASIPEVEIDMSINTICKKYQVEVKKRAGANANERVIGSITCARRIISQSGVKALDWMLHTIATTNWKDCSNAYSYEIMETMYSFYRAHESYLDNATVILKDIMNEKSPDTLIINARYEYKEYTRIKGQILYLDKLVDKKMQTANIF